MDFFEIYPTIHNMEKEKSLFEQYHDSIGKQIKVDDFNMKEVQMALPTNRHYWVGRLMFHKFELQRLKKMRKQASLKIIEKIKEESPVSLTGRAMDDMINHHEAIRKIDDMYTENELLIEYLSKIENNFRDLGFAIKNMIEIVRMETT